MLNLFALVHDPAARVQRFALDASVQAELTSYLQSQEDTFNSAGTEIQFDGKYKPDAGEVLFIPDFDDIDGFSAAIRDPVSIVEVVPSPDFFEKVCALFSGRVEVDGTRLFCFRILIGDVYFQPMDCQFFTQQILSRELKALD